MQLTVFGLPSRQRQQDPLSCCGVNGYQCFEGLWCLHILGQGVQEHEELLIQYAV